jgi:hypothetical protein
MIEEGRFEASIEVYNDLEKKDDELFKWCKDRKGKLIIAVLVWTRSSFYCLQNSSAQRGRRSKFSASVISSSTISRAGITRFTPPTDWPAKRDIASI